MLAMLKLLEVELINFTVLKTLWPMNKVFNDIENYFPEISCLSVISSIQLFKDKK